MERDPYAPLAPLACESGGPCVFLGTAAYDEELDEPGAVALAWQPAWRTRRALATGTAAFVAAALAAVVAVRGLGWRQPASGLHTPAVRGQANGLLGLAAQKSADGLLGLASTRKAHPKCHTALPGEECYKDVSWAITDGIYAHPNWYEGLSNKSNFETFQAVVYKINSTKCPLPCNYAPPEQAEAKHKDKGTKESHKAKAPDMPKGHPAGKLHREPKAQEESVLEPEDDLNVQDACHTAITGEECYNAVKWAMKEGIHTKPDWYEGLNRMSSFEAFQSQLHKTPKTNCPSPCECQTSIMGDKCHDHVLWVLKEGIKVHPDWYEGLTKKSRFEEAQSRLHEDKNTTCPQPCAERFFGDPSLFCFSVFQTTGYEPGLMKAQLEKREGIFSCDEFAIIADGHVRLGDGPYGPVETLVIPHTKVGVSKDNTAANTLIFIHAWQRIYEDFRFMHHDWTLKVDPDAVIVPERLRMHLGPHTGKKVYVKNCNKYPGAPNWPMMFGSLEAISQSCISLYMENSDRCRDELEWEAWGEDLYLAECLDLLGCDSVHDYKIISDKVCLGVDCEDNLAAAFHAFKSEQDWFQCWGEVFR